MDSLSATLSSLRLETPEEQKKITILQRPKDILLEQSTDSPKSDQSPSENNEPQEKCKSSDSPSEKAETKLASPAETGSENINPDSEQNVRRRLQLECQNTSRTRYAQAFSDRGDLVMAEQIKDRRPLLLRTTEDSPFKDWGLMQAEWLKSIPVDFEEEWIVVPCPVGKRCSLWALESETYSYTKQGFFLQGFESILPNGHYYSYEDGSTFLDAIYVENLSTYFVLDCLQWQSFDLRDCSAQFRLFYLNTKMSECNPADFPRRAQERFSQFIMPLPVFPCSALGVKKALEWQPLPQLRLEWDGLLFYHKQGAYSAGTTPLVAWIKAWMADEIFSNVEISPKLLERKPRLYKNYQTYMKEWDERESRKLAKAAERTGRKALSHSSPNIERGRGSKGAASCEKVEAKSEDDDDDQADPPLVDDPALREIALKATDSDNALLSLVGNNILDTFDNRDENNFEQWRRKSCSSRTDQNTPEETLRLADP